VVSVPTQEEFDALLKKVQVLELKIPELEKQVAESKAAVQLMRDMIDTAHAAIHPV
jgi:predicted  nucleic acid-binding Zn-ribbon protein